MNTRAIHCVNKTAVCWRAAEIYSYIDWASTSAPTRQQAQPPTTTDPLTQNRCSDPIDFELRTRCLHFVAQSRSQAQRERKRALAAKPAIRQTKRHALSRFARTGQLTNPPKSMSIVCAPTERRESRPRQPANHTSPLVHCANISC